MIDIKLIRDCPDLFIQAARNKRIEANIPRLLEIDGRLRDAKARLQDIAAEKNRTGKSIPKLVGDEKTAALARLADLKPQEEQLSSEVKALQPEFDALLLEVPQPADADVPLGKDDTENVEIRRHGAVRQFDFAPKDHVQLGQALDIIDIERGVKLAGTRNYFLKGDGALLHWAVLRFAMDLILHK